MTPQLYGKNYRQQSKAENGKGGAFPREGHTEWLFSAKGQSLKRTYR